MYQPHPNPYRLDWESGKSEAEKYREECKANREASDALRRELAATVAQRRSGNPAESGPLMAKAIKVARDSAAQTGHIDHTPGGSPGTWHKRIVNPDDAGDISYISLPTAPPPPTIHLHPMAGYEPAPKRPRKSGEPMGWSEAFNRCAAAARIELGARAHTDDVDDATQAVLMALESNVPGGFQADAIPEEWATMTRLRNLAANHWRKREREIARLAGEAQQAEAERQFEEGAEQLSPDERPNPYGRTREAAQRAASELMAALSLPPRCYVLAYSVYRLRALADILPANTDGKGRNRDGARIIASELGMTENAYRLQRSRGLKLAAQALACSPEQAVERLGVTVHRNPATPVALPANFAATNGKVRAHDSKRQDAREREGTRTNPGDRTPNARGKSNHYGWTLPYPAEDENGERIVIPAAPRTIHYGAPGAPAPGSKVAERTVSKRATTVKVAGKATTMRKAQPAWTKAISTGQARYLRNADGYRRQRAKVRTQTETAVRRIAVGLGG